MQENKTVFVLGSFDFNERKFISNGIWENILDAEEHLNNEYGVRCIIKLEYKQVIISDSEFYIYLGENKYHSTNVEQLNQIFGAEEKELCVVEQIITPKPSINNPLLFLSVFEKYIEYITFILL